MAVPGAVLLGLTACTRDDPGASSEPGTSPSTGESDATEEPRADPDEAALERAAALTVALVDVIDRAGRRVDPTGELGRLHASHLAALEGVPAPTESPSLPPHGSRPTAQQVRRQELDAQRELARLAEQAQSGAVARLLASMSAGVAAALAHLAQVPR
jgi:hypothetical protein